MRHLLRILLCVALLASSVAGGRAQEIWFGPQAPFAHYRGTEDWHELFKSDAAWPVTAHNTHVILSGNGTINGTPDDVLVAEFRFLQQHNIKVALPIQSIGRTDACPGGGEGFNTPAEGKAATDKLKRLGLRIDYIRLDNPLWFGHYATDPGTCQYPPDVLARQVWRNVREYVANFPDLIIGDIEVVPNLTDKPDWETQYRAWKQAFEAISGHRLAFVHAEIHAMYPAWQSGLRALAQMARQNGQSFGAVYNSSGPVRSDRDWIANTIALFETTESRLGVIPDHAVLQTWEPRPRFALPETSDSALSYLVVRYLKPRTKLLLTRDGDRITGEVLLQERGSTRPLPDVTVRIDALGRDSGTPLAVRTLTGRVPANARQGILAIRLNQECLCAGINDLMLGDMTYREAGPDGRSLQVPAADIARRTAGQDVAHVSVRAEARDGATVAHIATDTTGRFGYNSAIVPVTPGADYTLTVPVGTEGRTGLSGYVAVIWRDAAGKGLFRDRLYVQSEQTAITTVTAGQDGRFAVPAAAVRQAHGRPLRAILAETAGARGATADIATHPGAADQP